MSCGSAKFAVCQQGLDEETYAALQRESARFGDLLMLDCQEGYGEGLLVKKVLAALKTFVHESAMQRQIPKLFMKVDDDSFVAWSLLCPKIASVHAPFGFLYMGMPDMVNRTDWWFNNTESPNYDPWENWPYNFYPFHMAGGPGYLLGMDLAAAIYGSFMEPPISWNEDKAIGIGVFRAKKRGLPVRHVYLHMDDGEMDTLPFSGNWSTYPFYSQHQLSAKSISCLFELEMKNPAGLVNDCYQHTTWLRDLHNGVA